MKSISSNKDFSYTRLHFAANARLRSASATANYIIESVLKRGPSMTSCSLSRRDFSLRFAAFFSALGVVRPTLGGSGVALAPPFVKNEEISHAAETIHQEIGFKASRNRVYAALTDAKQFNKVVQLSAAGMSLGDVPTER